MKIEIKNIIIKLFAIFLCLLPAWAWGASYKVSNSISIVDGDTFCGGSACTSSDTIIIEGGARGSLLFKDFDGNGSYITITNEDTNPDSQVVITSDGSAGYGVLSIRDCKYVDLRGDNDTDLTYGIKVINDGNPAPAGSIWIRQQSDHIKISYIEVSFDGNTTDSGNGIFVQDTSLTSAWTYDTFVIHHNYIHGARYAGMYLGHNEPHPSVNDWPYVANFSIHNNLIEDSRGYGITYKGVNGPNNSIHHNTVRVTGLNAGYSESAKHGIGVQYFYGTYYANIYNNRIEKTVGAGLKIGDQKHNVYYNLILGCGTGNDIKWGNGIVTYNKVYEAKIYRNIIMQPTRYGIYGASGSISAEHSNNIIANAGIGEASGYNLTESIGDNANTYVTDVNDLNPGIVIRWSDDGDYSNDDFAFIVKKPDANPQDVQGFCVLRSVP